MSALARRAGGLLAPLIVPVAILVVWWIATDDSRSAYWPPLRNILTTFKDQWLFTLVGEDLVPSVVRLVIGFLAAVILGVAGGLVLGNFAGLRRAFMPLLDFVRAIPIAAVIPPAVLLLGNGNPSMTTLIAFASVWPILLNTVDGIRGVDGELHEMARVYRLSRRDRLLRVQLPAASPQIFAGLRVALALAVLTMVLVEIFLSANGIGYVISIAQTRFQVADMWAAMIVIMILAYVVNLAFLRLERVALRWHRESRAGADGGHEPGRQMT